MSVIALTTACVALLGQRVAAWPALYAPKEESCRIPAKSYGQHGSPENNDDLMFRLMDGDGSGEISGGWLPGTQYVVEVQFPEDVNMWIATTAGKFNNVPGDTLGTVVDRVDCQARAWYTNKDVLSNTQMVGFTSPECCTGFDSVTLSAAVATGANAIYQKADSTIEGDTSSCPEECPDLTDATAPAPVDVDAPDVTVVPIVPVVPIDPDADIPAAVAPVPVAVVPVAVVPVPVAVVPVAVVPAPVGVVAPTPADLLVPVEGDADIAIVDGTQPEAGTDPTLVDAGAAAMSTTLVMMVGAGLAMYLA